MKSVFFLLFFIITTTSNSYASFNRLWVGFKKKEVTTASFLNGLNKTFFKDTIEVGKGRGLISYQPYVTNMNSDIPDELALVIYESEEKYRQIRATPEGEKYSALHWDYFEKDISKSTVAQPFTGTLVEGQASELNSSFVDWQKGFTYVAIYSRDQRTNIAELTQAFNRLKENKDINNSILLITSKWIIEYRSLKKSTSIYEKMPLKILEQRLLSNESLSSMKEAVGFGQGLNFQF